jgi:hypothetical protein
MSETYKTLSEKHGVLLSYEVLGQVMDRSPDGLRLSLKENRSDWARCINAAKVRIGRRVHFRTELIAALIDDSTVGLGAEPAAAQQTGRVAAKGESAGSGRPRRNVVHERT